VKTYSTIEPKVYDVSGMELRIHWNIKQVPAPAMAEDQAMQWEANEALCCIFDERGVLISKIIRSVYSVDAEIATINNQATKPGEYEAYQAFRAQAKALADGWLAGPEPEEDGDGI
jgi:predicted Mrr-cat superfamily restriction endonuclease